MHKRVRVPSKNKTLNFCSDFYFGSKLKNTPLGTT